MPQFQPLTDAVSISTTHVYGWQWPSLGWDTAVIVTYSFLISMFLQLHWGEISNLQSDLGYFRGTSRGPPNCFLSPILHASTHITSVAPLLFFPPPQQKRVSITGYQSDVKRLRKETKQMQLQIQPLQPDFLGSNLTFVSCVTLYKLTDFSLFWCLFLNFLLYFIHFLFYIFIFHFL